MGSSSSKSDSSNASKSNAFGGCWQAYLRYYHDFDDDDESFYELLNEDMVKVLNDKKYSDLLPNEDIINETYYWTALEEAINGNPALLYHTFIVYKTKSWYYLVSKGQEGILMVRGKNLKKLLDSQKNKTKPQANGSFSGGGRDMFGVIKFMIRNDCINKGYNVMSSNCQQFTELLKTFR